MNSSFKQFFSKNQALIKKVFFLAFSVLSSLMLLWLLFEPFCSYSLFQAPSENDFLPLKPIQAIGLLQNPAIVTDGIGWLALGLFILLVVLILIESIFLIKSVFAFFGAPNKQPSLAKILLIFVSIVTALYFLSSIIVCTVGNALGGAFAMTNNFLPFIFMLVLDVAYAILAGIVKKSNDEKQEEVNMDAEKKVDRKKRRRSVFKARAELFVFTLIIAAITVFALLTNIITASVSTSSASSLIETSTPISITGLDMFLRYEMLDESGQVIAFIIFTMLVLVLTLFFLSLVSFLGGSTLYYKIAICSLLFNILCCLLVGLFGKYYEIVQKLNESMIKSIIESMLGFEPTQSMTYKTTSTSFYFFLLSVVVLGIFLLRRPYSRGITMERELELEFNAMLPSNLHAEVSVTEMPEPATGGVISTDVTGNQTKVLYADPCPPFTELDEKIPEYTETLERKRLSLFEAPTLPKLVQFIVNYARDSRLHLSYTEEDIATFLAGLGTTKLSILQGMSGTGKTSLPKIFAEALCSDCEIIEVESSWRDKNELLGYYNEFSKTFTPKKFTQVLYRARLNPDTLMLIVLDEMNLSRIEYYFSDFLSLMENEPDKRELRLLNVGLYRTEAGKRVPYQGLSEGHNIKIPPNVWFIGTANRDESTFEISDKVYDRANTINFNKRAAKVQFFNEPIPAKYLPVDELDRLFKEAKEAVNFNVDEYPVIGEVEKLLAPYNISFGNRIAMQIESFVSIYCSCFSMTESVVHNAVETILLSKVVSKLELKSVDNKEQLATAFEKLGLLKCSKFILKLNED